MKKTYTRNKKASTTPIIGFTLLSFLSILLIFYATKNFWTIALIVIFLLLIPMFYSGIIFKIVVDDEKIKIYRLGWIDTIKFVDVAICADHKIDDDRSLIYCFMRQGKGVKAIRGRKSFEEIVKLVLSGANMTKFDLNFNRAKKIQLAFVNDAADAKKEILFNINLAQLKTLEKI